MTSEAEVKTKTPRRKRQNQGARDLVTKDFRGNRMSGYGEGLQWVEGIWTLLLSENPSFALSWSPELVP
jgi:hypothetical protein